MLDVRADGRVDAAHLRRAARRSNRLANALRARGVGRGDRVAILLPQGAAVPIAHVAIYKLGAVALPLAALFGADALSYRLQRFRRQGADHQCARAREAREAR